MRHWFGAPGSRAAPRWPSRSGWALVASDTRSASSLGSWSIATRLATGCICSIGVPGSSPSSSKSAAHRNTRSNSRGSAVPGLNSHSRFSARTRLASGLKVARPKRRLSMPSLEKRDP